MASIYDRILQESTLFELFESKSYTDTQKSLILALEVINSKILSIKGDTWTKRRLREVKALIDKEIALAYSLALPTLQKELPLIAGITAANMLQTSFTHVPLSIIDTITSNTFQVQGYSAKELFDTISDNHARQLRVLVGSGVAQGRASRAIVDELFIKHSSLSRAQLRGAVFTTISDARSISRHSAYTQMEKLEVIKGYEYVAVLDGRTSEYCRDHDHIRYYKPIKEIAHLIGVHFRCRSIFSPFTKTTKKDTRASQFGPIPDQSYEQWFSTQDKNFQRSVLGNKKFSEYKKGDYEIGGLADVKGKKLSLSKISSILEDTQE